MAYSGVVAQPSNQDLKRVLKQDVSTWKVNLKNDFEQSVFSEFPLLESIKKELYKQGATYACMSGSGSSIFGIFDDEPAIEKQDKYSSWILKLD